MAFWKKKSEDPWDMDPNRRREPATFYERDPEPQSEPVADAERMKGTEAAAEQNQTEEAPVCPWCGKNMVRAYLLGGRDMLRLADQRPHAFWGSLGHEKTYLGDNTDFLGGNYQSCWQCKPCYKLVIDVPRPTASNGGWESGTDSVPESGACWDGNPVAPYVPEDPQE